MRQQSISKKQLEAQIRKKRLELLKKYSYEIEDEAKKRLEFQPIFRGKGRQKEFYTLAMLRLSLTKEGLPTETLLPFVTRDALKSMKLHSEIEKSIMFLLKNADFKKQLLKVLFMDEKKEEYNIYFKDVNQKLKIALTQKNLSEKKADNIARSYLENCRKIITILREKPVFFRTTKAKPVIRVQKGFDNLINKLLIKAKGNITEFIEKQKNVERPQEFKVEEAKSIMDLLLTPYDLTKIKEFELETEKGKIAIVSKRLTPIKSPFAENEFKLSIQLKRLGIPVPEPIAEIRQGNNVYFLWKKLKQESFDQRFSEEIQNQKEDIKRKLKDNGFIATDLEDRNFVITKENNKPKVYLVDFERIYKKSEH